MGASFTTPGWGLMFTLITELSPLREVVGSLVENVDLSIRSIGAHYFLLDRLSDGDLLY